MNKSPLSFEAVERQSRFERDSVRSAFRENPTRYSLMGDVPPGEGELAWGLPFWVTPKVYSRMSLDFTIPVDGAPVPSIKLVPQSSPPTGRFPVTIGAETKYVDLEFVVFT